MQRNRDHGLAGYNDYREFCGLKRAHDWEDFLDLISIKDVANLQSLYSTPDDVDLTVGGSLETHVAGALAGPTFLCILTEQFYRTRVGDRFFYEHGDKETQFTRSMFNLCKSLKIHFVNYLYIMTAQLNEIRKASVARLMCDNSNHIQSIQPKGFLTTSKR